MTNIEILKRLYKDYTKRYISKIFLAFLFTIILAGSTSSVAYLLDPAIKQLFIEQNKNTKLKRPNNWGGIEIFINQIEFWQGRKNRLHNRVLCNFQKDTWEYKLLSP